MRSRIEPMKKVARMLRSHRELLLNWFRAKKQISAGVVEGFNNKAKLIVFVYRVLLKESWTNQASRVTLAMDET
jgi:hypothetical protein